MKKIGKFSGWLIDWLRPKTKEDAVRALLAPAKVKRARKKAKRKPK